MTSAELTALRRIYGEICRGYSETTWRGNPVYVAHLTTFDQTDIDAAQELAYAEAVARGVKTEKQRLKWLEDNKVWTEVNEKEIVGLRWELEGLEKSHSKAALKLQRDAVMKQLVESRGKLDTLLGKRSRAIGITAERVAEQKVQYEYIRVSFYKDSDLTERLLSIKDIHALDDIDADDLLVSYVDVASRFSTENIKRIAVQPFFSNQFSLCGKALHTFFNVPIVDLTLYQANLLSFGQYYHSIFMNHEIPKDIRDDPAKIDEYMVRSTNAKSMLARAGNQEGGRVGIVGATKEDFEAMGVKDGTNDMRGFAKKEYKDGRDAAKDMGYTLVDPKR